MTKMLMIMYTGEDPKFVPGFLDRQGCPWTEFAGGIGHGHSHLHDGSRAFPGHTLLVLSILEHGRCVEVADALRGVAAAQLPESDHLHVAVVPVEQFA